MTDAGKPTDAEKPTVEKPKVDFKCKVNENLKSTELPLLRLGGTVQENPHMRAFWASTCSFFIAFVGWFALAPVAIDVMYSIGECENQKLPPESNLKHKPYVTFVNIKTKKPYCIHGKVDDASDCKEIPAAEADITACEDASSEECAV